MNPFRYIYPLRLRQSLYFRLKAENWSWPALPPGGYRLDFANVRLTVLLPTDHSHRQIAHLGFYELQLSRALKSLARQGGLLVDVGANVGYFTCLWTALNPCNTAYAFEPAPRNLAMLEQNVRAQPFKERIKTFTTALGRENGESDFHLGPSEQTGWGGLVNSASTETVRVRVQRLDEIIPADTEIAVLKVDTEGADAWVLEGALGLLRCKRIRHVFCERNVPRMSALGIRDGTIEDLLREAGYTVDYLDGRRRGEIRASSGRGEL